MTKSMKIYLAVVGVLILVILTIVCSTLPFIGSKKEGSRKFKVAKLADTKYVF